MKKHQKGEVMLAVMAVMLLAIWLGSGHTGMMGMGGGHGNDSAMKPSQTDQQTKVEPASNEPPIDSHDHKK